MKTVGAGCGWQLGKVTEDTIERKAGPCVP